MRYALRLTMACLAVGLAVAAFRISKLPPPISALIAVFCIFCAARLQNDWRDRFHDIRKGKLLASIRPKLFLICVIVFWGICFLLLGTIALRNSALAALLAPIVLAALVYSEMRRIPWLPICISAIASAAPALLPCAFAADMDRMLPLFGAAALLIFGREILKDLEDREIDGGYKWTIPLAYGNEVAKRLAFVSVAAACAAVASLSPLVLAGVLCALFGLSLFWRESSPALVMKWLDTGAALAIAALAAFPP